VLVTAAIELLLLPMLLMVLLSFIVGSVRWPR
jgi:hypothetical protein